MRKEIEKMMIPVNPEEMVKGTWRNVTRDQYVEIETIYHDSVEYKWNNCTIKKFYYTKSKEHFLRSYRLVQS